MTDPVDLTTKPGVSAHFDAATNTISYVVKDRASALRAIVDSVMDIDDAADHLSAVPDIQARLGG